MQLDLPGGRLPSELWPRQRDAADCVLNAFAMGRTRQQVIMPCGTGKTHLAVHVAHEVAVNSRSLTVLPTLELLNQTARVWYTAGRPGLYLGVCSDEQTSEPVLDGILTMTDDPAHLAHAMRTADGPVNVFATYAALKKLRLAHHDHRLPRWDIAIVDEAHRTAGARSKAWGAIHDDDAIPARHRLYLTATPRIWDVNRGVAGEPIASMDDVSLFGTVAYRYSLAEAIHDGRLADYRIAAPEIHHPQLRAFLTDRTRRGRTPQADAARVAAAQLALLKAREGFRIQRTVSFSRSVVQCEALAETLPQTAAAIPGGHADRLWVSSVHHKLSRTERRERMSHFGQAPEAGPPAAPAELRVLCNVRLCVEGVDFPLADSVLFADPKRSTIDIFQAVGRALRIGPGMNKISTLIIPVLFGPGQSPEEAAFGTPYHLLHQVMIALRAYDEHYFYHLPISGRRLLIPTPDYAIRPARAPEIAPHLMLRIMEPEPDLWNTGMAAARAFHTAHGHLDVPSNHITDDGFHLGCWLGYQRALKAAGHLSAARVAALATFNLAWHHHPDSTETFLETAQAYAREHGHLLPHDPQESYQRRPLAQWLLQQRRRDDENALPAPYRRALRDIDRWWNPHWPDAWQRTLIQVRDRTSPPAITGGPLDGDADPATRWLDRQFDMFPTLDKAQRQQLAALPFKNSPLALALHRSPTDHFAGGLRAARHFYRQHHHLNVPPGLHAGDGDRRFPLGPWLADLRGRFRRNTLGKEEIAALDALAMEWTPQPRSEPEPGPPPCHPDSALHAASGQESAARDTAMTGEQPPMIWLAQDDPPPALAPVIFEGGGRRALIDLPAGAGKTIIAASTVHELDPAPCLILGPNAPYLRQAAATWRKVCDGPQAGLEISLRRGPRLTSAADLADWLRQQPPAAQVFARYDQARRIADSHRHHDLPAWGHLIIEEAHHTAEGIITPEHPYADIHYDDRILAHHRLYLTATSRIPRQMTLDIKTRDVDWAVHMPAQGIFGSHVLTTSREDLVEQEVLAPRQLGVCRIRRNPGAWSRSKWRAEANATTQIIKHHQLRRVLVALATNRDAEEFGLRLAVDMVDAEILVEGQSAVRYAHNQPIIHCLRATCTKLPRKLDAIILPDPRCTALQLVNALHPLMAQSPRDVPSTRVIVPHAVDSDDDPPSEQSLLFQRAAAAYWAHAPGRLLPPW
ncbi:Helicase associated domain protein [Streptomyces atriruber]|uniref:Helicase associated domain protein n=1 Tax=Streptomyces atriruber TaxID=545121 RepID=UPI00099E9B0C|nr:Helicase associated domain protein [Streptomyces atriruber]